MEPWNLSFLQRENAQRGTRKSQSTVLAGQPVNRQGTGTERSAEQKLKNNLYKIWNRMSSGTYFPPPVRRVMIPKSDGRERPLGIPTVGDRVAQMVVKMELEPKVEPLFHPDSYGYRPKKSALDAVGTCRQRCWRCDWVVDLDIKGFFDNIDHPDKTRLVYSRDSLRRKDHDNIQFDFLGYTFRPRSSKGRHGYSTGFFPAISGKARQTITAEIRSWKLQKWSDRQLTDLARVIKGETAGLDQLLRPILPQRSSSHLQRHQ